MRSLILPSLLVILLVVSACDKPDEIVPVMPPVPENQAAPAKAPEDEKEAPASVHPESYEYGEFKDMPYRILFPRKYDSAKTYPLLVYLHGIGERGSDNERQLNWSSSLFLKDSIRDKYPAFILFPQCQQAHYWSDQWGTETLKGLISSTEENYNINKAKLYIVGFSMGAYGTYAMVAQNPELFAAAIPISGDGDARKASTMTKTKWRIFAGKKDNVVPSGKSEKMAEALFRSGASVSFTLYPDADHTGSWTKAFSEPDFCSWLFSVSGK